MLGFTHAVQTETSVSEEKKEPEPIPLYNQENGADLRQPAQSILLPPSSKPFRETNRGSLPKPPLLRRSVQLTSGEVPLKRDPNVIPDSAVPPTMNGMMASQAGIAIQPENQYLAGVPHNDNDEREASIHQQPVTTMTPPPPPQDLPVMEGISVLPTMDGMVLPQPDTTIEPENQYFSFKLDDDDDSESESSAEEQPVTTTTSQNLPVMEDLSALPTMDGMVLPQPDTTIEPENQYFSFKLDDDDDDSESESTENENQSNIHEQPVTIPLMKTSHIPNMGGLPVLPTMDGMVLPQPDTTIEPENQYFSFKLDDDDDDSESESSADEQSMPKPSPQNLPIMEGISVQPPFNPASIPGMGDCGPSTVVPTPSPYPTPNVTLPTAPVISASILPSTQTNSYSETPSMNSAAHSASSADLNASMQSTLTDLDLPYPRIADELGISYPQLADQLNESETKPSEAPAVKNGFSFPNPPTLNQTVQSNRGAAQPGTISVILPPITTVNEGQVSTQESLRIPSSSCRNVIL